MFKHISRMYRPRAARKEIFGRIALVIVLGLAIWMKYRMEEGAPPPRATSIGICDGC